jgi:hypothetical protein
MQKKHIFIIYFFFKKKLNKNKKYKYLNNTVLYQLK